MCSCEQMQKDISLVSNNDYKIVNGKYKVNLDTDLKSRAVENNAKDVLASIDEYNSKVLTIKGGLLV